MRLLFAALAVLSCSTVFAVEPGSIEYLDHKNGFRDMKFGDPIEKLSPRSLELDLFGRVLDFVRPGDQLTMGSADVDEILYRFLDLRLGRVQLSISQDSSGEHANCEKLFDAAKTAYGPPTREDSNPAKVWAYRTKVRAYYLPDLGYQCRLIIEADWFGKKNDELNAIFDALGPGEFYQVPREFSPYPDYKDGFRDMSFGDPIEKLGPRVSQENSCGGRSKSFRRTGDQLRIGSASVDRIEYIFFDGALVLVKARAPHSSIRNCELLVEAAKQAYGSTMMAKSEWTSPHRVARWSNPFGASPSIYWWPESSLGCELSIVHKPTEKVWLDACGTE